MQVGAVVSTDTLTSLLQTFNNQYEQDPLKADTPKVIASIADKMKELEAQNESNESIVNFPQEDETLPKESFWLSRPVVIVTDILSPLANVLNVIATGINFSSNQDSEKQTQAALGTALASTVLAAPVLYIQYLQAKATAREAEVRETVQSKRNQLVLEKQKRIEKKLDHLTSLNAFLQSFYALQTSKSEREFKACLASRDKIPRSSKYNFIVPSVGKLVPSLGDAIPAVAIKPVIQEIFNTTILLQSSTEEKESKEGLHTAKQKLEAQWEKLDKLTGIRVNSFNYMNKTIVRNWEKVEEQQPSSVPNALTIRIPETEQHPLRTHWPKIYEFCLLVLLDTRYYSIHFDDGQNYNEVVSLKHASLGISKKHMFMQGRGSHELTVLKILQKLYPDFLSELQMVRDECIELSPLNRKIILPIPLNDPINDKERPQLIGELWRKFLSTFDDMCRLEIFRSKGFFSSEHIKVVTPETLHLIIVGGSFINLGHALSPNAIEIMSFLTDLNIMIRGDLKSADSIITKYRLIKLDSFHVIDIRT